MKKSLVAIAALAATGVFAQSSVTLSGVLDVGTVYRTNVQTGNTKFSVGSGNNNRLIFSGVEDLGGGLAATFGAQMRFDPTSGGTESGGARPLFQGESRVGLRGAFGQVRLGRGLTALQAPNSVAIDPWVVTTVASSIYAPGYVTDYVAGGEGRTDGIFYDTPNFGGLSASLTFSPRKVATTTTFGKPFTSFAVNYNNGPIVAIVGYEKNRYGDSLTNIGGNYNLGVAKIYAGFGSVKGGLATDRAGVTYAAGAGVTPGYGAAGAFGTTAAYTGGMTKLGQVNGNIEAGTKTDAFSIGAVAPFGPAKVLFGYSTYKSNIATAARDNKLGLGVNYALSKRTSIYSDIASTTRNNNSVNANEARNNSRVNAFDLGIAHSF